MTRSVWKGTYLKKSVKTKFNIKKGRNDLFKIWSRGSRIISEFVGTKVMIYNGARFLIRRVTPEMVGHTFGAFS